MENIELSVIITVYSEEKSLAETVAILFKNDTGYIREILLVVAAASSAACQEVCRRLATEDHRVIVVPQKNNQGVGWAIREGFSAARGNYVAIISADLETDPETVAVMVQKIGQTACEVVIADRWLPASRFENYSRGKLILNWLFQHLFRPLLSTSVGDLTYGFKILHQRVVKSIEWEGTRHEIFIETTIKPIKEGFSVTNVPTIWRGRQEGRSKNNFLNNLRYVWLAIKVVSQSPQVKSGKTDETI